MASLAPVLPGRSEGPVLGIEPQQWIRLANWLLVWVVLANAAFVMMWLVGAPPRGPEIIATGAIGLVVRNRRPWLQFVAFCAAMIYSVFGFVAGLFNLSIASLLHSLQFFAELDPLQSVEYVLGAVAILLLVAATTFQLRRSQTFTDLRMVLLAIGAVLLVAQFDTWAGQGMRGHYKREAVAGAVFTSAVSQTDFGIVAAGAAPRHLLVIMVESLGEPVGNPELDRLMFSRYRKPDVARRFEAASGTTTYYNSTTAGEVRELCGRWGDYYELLEQRDESCLPARLRRQGFETIAYHTFAGGFFERDTWYPNIGFEQRVFADDLIAAGLSECGGMFPGACDREMPQVLAGRLKAAKKPQLVYWLTVNSHLPVPPGANLEVENCQRTWPQLAEEYPMICRQFAIWDDIDTALAKEITAPDFPPTDILIVGDHMPPYFDRHNRSQFAPDRVPWLLLRWRGDEEAHARAPNTQVAKAATARTES